MTTATKPSHSEARVDETELTKTASNFGEQLAKICGELTRFTVTVDPEALKLASIDFAKKVVALCGSPPLLSNGNDAAAVAAAVRDRRDLKDEIEEYVAPMANPLNKLHKLCTGWRAALTAPLVSASEADEKLLARYIVDAEILAAADRNDAQAQTDREYDRRINREAKKLEKVGRGEDADTLRRNAELNRPIVPTIPVEVPKGVTVARNYHHELVDLALVNRRFLMLDEKKIKEQVKLLGPDAADVVGGIRVVEDDPDATVRR